MKIFSNKKGSILVLIYMVMATLVLITTSFLFLKSTQIKSSGNDIANTRAFYLAEAGLQKAIWNLKTPTGSGGRGENWTTSGVTENLNNGTYKMVVSKWDWALDDHNSTASASSSSGSKVSEKAIDGSNSTYWESKNTPTSSSPQYITIAFPYSLTINKARFYVGTGSNNQAPKDYKWQVSENGASYSTVFSASGNTSKDVTNEFTARTNVNYLRLSVSAIVSSSSEEEEEEEEEEHESSQGVKISTIEALGNKITSTGTFANLSKQVEQTVAVDDATQTLYAQIDWREL